MNQEQEQKIALWVELLMDEAISPEEFQELESLLEQDEQARALYLDLMGQDTKLNWFDVPLPKTDA